MKNWILFSLTSPKFWHTNEAHQVSHCILVTSREAGLSIRRGPRSGIDLQIYQEDDLILGTGVSADQSGLAVNATGSVAEDRPNYIHLLY